MLKMTERIKLKFIVNSFVACIQQLSESINSDVKVVNPATLYAPHSVKHECLLRYDLQRHLCWLISKFVVISYTVSFTKYDNYTTQLYVFNYNYMYFYICDEK